MIRRLILSVAMILGIAIPFAALGGRASAQNNASPVAGASLALPGVTTRLVATGDVKFSGLAEPRLQLEQIDLSSGNELAEHEATGSELIVVAAGAVDIADSFGFSSSYAAGESVSIAAETAYTLAASDAEEARVYRLAVVGTEATAGSSNAGASPVAEESSMLIDAPIKVSRSEVTIFLAELSWSAGTSSGQLDHSGPLGVYVETGSLKIVSPSGITGNVKAGKSVVLPASAPLIASNGGNGEAVALVAGVSLAPDALLVPFIPTPTPTATSTSTATPTPTATATYTATATSTPSPTPTVAPTNTAIPTSTPSPTATPVPVKPGSTLYKATKAKEYEKLTMSGGWQIFQSMIVNNGSGGIITLPYAPPVADYKFEVDVQPVKGRERVYLQARDGMVSAVFTYYDNSLYAVSFLIGDKTVGEKVYPEIRGGDWHKLGLEVSGNQVKAYIDGKLINSNTDNRLISGGSGGQVTLTAGNNQQVNVKNFKITAGGGSSSGGDQSADDSDESSSAIVPKSGTSG
jgi:hypothetical protein